MQINSYYLIYLIETGLISLVFGKSLRLFCTDGAGLNRADLSCDGKMIRKTRVNYQQRMCVCVCVCVCV